MRASVSAFSVTSRVTTNVFFNALVRMFERALNLANTLPASGRVDLVRRLDAVRQISHKIGYGVGDDMDFLTSRYGDDRVKRR
jgi:hypothetical protein